MGAGASTLAPKETSALRDGLLQLYEKCANNPNLLQSGPNLKASGKQLEDPRKIVSKFFGQGDRNGPFGSLVQAAIEASKTSEWFVVFRPCSQDSIEKMRSGRCTGKGLNIKGKSAKGGHLSAMVPFLQISTNEHRSKLCTPPRNSRLHVYYQSSEARDKALKVIAAVLKEMMVTLCESIVKKRLMDLGTEYSDEEEEGIFKQLLTAMDDPNIRKLNDYAPKSYGLDMPERLLREAYIMRQDITPPPGWETGRGSEPAFMDMNIYSLRESKNPRTVIFQFDHEKEMNPRGLVMAYAEKEVNPVVSDFDPFLIGSQNVEFTPFSAECIELMEWCLQGTEGILENADPNMSWTSCWLEILKREAEKGFHPQLPEFGFSDDTTYKIIGDLVAATSTCGAVRHGSECFNWYFPQELDNEYLVVWHGFAKEDGSDPWRYFQEPDLRKFLLERIAAEFSFPLNPCWTVRDNGWYEVLQALRNSRASAGPMAAWFPASSGILDKIDALHKAFPNGLQAREVAAGTQAGEHDMDACELADMAKLNLRRHMILKRAKKKFWAFLVMQSIKRNPFKAADKDEEDEDELHEPPPNFGGSRKSTFLIPRLSVHQATVEYRSLTSKQLFCCLN